MSRRPRSLHRQQVQTVLERSKIILEERELCKSFLLDFFSINSRFGPLCNMSYSVCFTTVIKTDFFFSIFLKHVLTLKHKNCYFSLDAGGQWNLFMPKK